MKLKHLEIKHKQYYSSKPDTDRYDGSIEFFNTDGHAMKIVLTEELMKGIVNLAAEAITDAARQAAEAIVASLNPNLILEHAPIHTSSRPLDCTGLHDGESGQQVVGKCDARDS